MLLIAACGAPPAVVAKPPVVVATPADAAVASGPAMLEHSGPLRAKIEAPHGQPISQVAATTDGTTAMTLDEGGTMRLWPALDGTREPCVVDFASPREFAIGRARDGVFVALIDAAHGLVLAVVDDQGRTLRHLAIAQDAAFVGIEMTALGVLAWRDDQTIMLYSFTGAQVARLGTEPGQRLTNVVANGHFAIAEVEVLAESGSGTTSSHVVRSLQLEPTLAWGAPIELGGEPQGTLAISPSGKRVAGTVVESDLPGVQLRAIDRATGKLVARAKLDATSELGFIDEDHLAVGVGDGVSWLALEPRLTPTALTGALLTRGQFAVGAGVAISPTFSDLRIAKPDGAKFLGYGLETAQVAALAPDGGLMIGAHGIFAQLDGGLAVRSMAAPTLPANTNVAELVWLGKQDYVANLTSTGDGANSVMIVATDARAPLPVRPATPGHAFQPIRYEPASHLLTVSFGDAPGIERWQSESRTLDHVATLPHLPGFAAHQLVPIAPALSGGAELVDIALDEASTVTWTDATMKKKLASTPIAAFVNVDPAGRVYAWRVDPAASQLQLGVFVQGRFDHALAHEGAVTLWPDATGARVIEVGPGAVADYRADGTLVWKQLVPGATKALWPAADTIAIVTASGIVMLDAATGAVGAMRCGWRFELAATQHVPPPRTEPVCTMLR